MKTGQTPRSRRHSVCGLASFSSLSSPAPPVLLAALGLAGALSLAGPVPAWGRAEDSSGYRPHREWLGAYADTTNLLNENSSFEVGDAPGASLGGCYFYQRTFARCVSDPSNTMRTAFQDFAFDSTQAAHGTRCLEVDLDKAYYAGGDLRNTARVCLSWDYVTIPPGREGIYEVSFFASASVPTDVHVNLISVGATGDLRWEWMLPSSGFRHATRTIDSDTLAQYFVTTRDPVTAERKYAVVLWVGADETPEWTPVENTILRFDAVQFARHDGPEPRPFAYHTRAEEMFLSLREGESGPARPDNVLLQSEAPAARVRVDLYQDPSLAGRPADRVFWKLFSLASGPDGVRREGSVSVSFASGPRQARLLDFSSGPPLLLGTYKLVAEYVDGYGQVADRQEMIFAIVRDPVAHPPGSPGNFGLHSGLSVASDDSGLPPYRFEVGEKGRLSAAQGLDWARRLGFTRDRVFGGFNYGSACDDPECATPRIPDFHAAEATAQGITLAPVINTSPAGFDEANPSHWTYYRDYLSYLWGQYGPQGTSGDRMDPWIIRNEPENVLAQGPWDPEVEARYLLEAAAVVGDGCLMTSMCNGVYIPAYLRDVMPRQVNGAGPRAGEVLDAIGINRYLMTYDDGHDYYSPERELWWAHTPFCLTELRMARFALQTLPFPAAVTRYAITETGCDPGWLRSDRLTGGNPEWSGSLAQALTTTEKMMRLELLCLGEGATPIYFFETIPNPLAMSRSYGLMTADGMPAAPLAAQAQMNAELGNATVVRAIAGEDMSTYGAGACQTGGNQFAKAVLFRDGGDYVLAAWKWVPGSDDFCVDLDPSTCTITARDMEGNPASLTFLDDAFVMHLTAAPLYVRISGCELAPAELIRRIDLDPTPAPAWDPDPQTCSGIDGEKIWARFRIEDLGDLAEVRLYARGGPREGWSCVSQAAWAKPDSSYTMSFWAAPDVPYEIYAVGIEKTTSLEGAHSDTIQVSRIPQSLPPPPPPPPPPAWRDALTRVAPNPTAGEIVLSGVASRPGILRVELYSIAGRKVRESSRTVAAGPFEVRLDRSTSAGTRTPAGVYFLRVRRDEVELARRRLIFVE